MEFINKIEQFAQENDLIINPIKIGELTAYKTSSNALNALLSFVKNSRDLRFTILTDLFSADFPSRLNRFEVTYNLLSLKLNKRLLFKIEIEEKQTVPSIAHLFSAACWYEREVFDMFGIYFDGCPDLRRILTDYSFVGHPLRKDFPLTGHLQVKYDKTMEKIVHEPVLLEQEFRNFDFSSPWQGTSK